MSTIQGSQLSNRDLAPTGPERRTWGTHHLAALWVGLSIVITTYGVFVALGLSAVAYVGLMRAQSTAREPATATE